LRNECYHDWFDWPAAGSVEARAISHIVHKLRETFKERFEVHGTMEKAKEQAKVTLLESILQPCLGNGSEGIHEGTVQLLGIVNDTLNLGLMFVDDKTMGELDEADVALVDGSNVAQHRPLNLNTYDNYISNVTVRSKCIESLVEGVSPPADRPSTNSLLPTALSGGEMQTRYVQLLVETFLDIERSHNEVMKEVYDRVYEARTRDMKEVIASHQQRDRRVRFDVDTESTAKKKQRTKSEE
jgi:hypothetical protein